MMKRLALMLMLVALCACSHQQVRVTALTTNRYPASGDVEVVAGDVAYPYEVLAALSAHMGPGAVEALKDAARALGATALVNMEVGEGPGMILGGGLVANTHRLKALAVRRKDGPGAAVATPSF
jgi:hypothetical protein